ncbi:chemotaxis protein CheR [Geomonas limicola]|uniref:protein-glutamate O-methyltransferase n=1 Tax=Geomonas limicola TaxID=2740186 RepID=A0A6V8N3H0_9BACT|nr:chemotaxis protein CheB [Geomonas limicola]GFO66991.1 chemotaxis protein CheR [Geomonas limicola]
MATSAAPRQEAAPAEFASEAFPVVGIGTSAGGLDALELFLGHTPPHCGMAIVIIQHLSPDHSGSLPQLLQRATTMLVQEATHALRMRPNQVYVIPPKKELIVRNRILYLKEPAEKHGLRLPINTFFCSLAEDCAELGIGVILSGMGSDGTEGMHAIKEKSGLTLVQDPATAKFDSMPQSVVNGGLSDIVAPAEELPAHIIEYLASTLAIPNPASVPSQGEGYQSGFQQIMALLKQRVHHDFASYKPSSVLRRIERRMNLHNFPTLSDYANFLQINPHEVDLLFKELLIGVTCFFRDPQLWDEIRDVVLPKILASYPDEGMLRAWSCGCSTGEEAYSLAILFREVVDQFPEPERYGMQIFATDLDLDAIARARRGIFSLKIANEVSPERLSRYFTREEYGYRIDKQIRDMVIFAHHNVTTDPPYTKLDLLICRNLLIYLSAELQYRLIPLFHYSLKPGGLLFLGSAESVGNGEALFRPAGGKSKLFWRSDSVLPKGVITFPTALTSQHTFWPQEHPMPRYTDNIQPIADRLILRHFSAPTVMVNEHGDIVYINGRTGKYLEPAAGKANMNIFAMARGELLYEMGTTFALAQEKSDPVTVRAKLVTDNGSKQVVEITMVRVEAPEALRGMVLISFRDVPTPPIKHRRAGAPPDPRQYEEMEQELLKLRNELRLSHEETQTTQEELKAINEELQSTNEELQSTNEELTTSKEEMQSMNEELQTVNAEQNSRLEEYMRASNDMENLLDSTEIVTIFLDSKLMVRRFTTGANRLFKLIPADVGRQLTDLVSELSYPELVDDVQEVLRRLITLEKQVPTLDQRWMQVRIMPYRTMEKRIDGVVLTFTDITASKRIERELKEKIARLEAQLNG